MDAFNVPYTIFDPNQSIPSCTFAETTEISFVSTTVSSWSHTVTHDICMIHINTMGSHYYGTGGSSPGRDCSITCLKDSDLDTIYLWIPYATIAKSGATITVTNKSSNYNGSAIITIYEFNFA